MTDEQLRLLMAAGMAGDRRAHAALLAGCAVRLRAYYRRRLGGHDADVEDLVQDTLVAIHNRRESYNPRLPFTPWLYGIGRYKLVDHLRRSGRRATVALDDVSEPAAKDDGEAILKQLDVERLLATLPPKQAEAIRLTKLEGLSVSEAAQRSDQSEPSVKVGIHRGLKRLAALIQGHGR